MYEMTYASEVTVLLEAVTSTVNTDQAESKPQDEKDEIKRKEQRSEARKILNEISFSI